MTRLLEDDVDCLRLEQEGPNSGTNHAAIENLSLRTSISAWREALHVALVRFRPVATIAFSWTNTHPTGTSPAASASLAASSAASMKKSSLAPSISTAKIAAALLPGQFDK